MIEEEKAKYVPLETGLTSEDRIEVLKGLKEGDVVVTRGSNLLKDGDRVRVRVNAARVLTVSSGGIVGSAPRMGQMVPQPAIHRAETQERGATPVDHGSPASTRSAKTIRRRG
jgi:hypothetical protein